ncbi:hypothetical protein TNCV_4987711 [Trichonephila clavipes]|nr:hypothetical protein TNCV_4987711 [Trichonephila clavipes]
MDRIEEERENERERISPNVDDGETFSGCWGGKENWKKEERGGEGSRSSEMGRRRREKINLKQFADLRFFSSSAVSAEWSGSNRRSRSCSSSSQRIVDDCSPSSSSFFDDFSMILCEADVISSDSARMPESPSAVKQHLAAPSSGRSSAPISSHKTTSGIILLSQEQTFY